MSKHIYHSGLDGQKIWIDPGILDLHGRPLIPPSIVTEPTKNAFMIETGKSFTIDHTDPKMRIVSEWLRSDQRFQTLDKELLPSGSRAGDGNSH